MSTSPPPEPVPAPPALTRLENVTAPADESGHFYSKAPNGAAGEYSMNHSYRLSLADRYGMLATTVEYGAPAAQLADLSQKLLRQ